MLTAPGPSAPAVAKVLAMVASGSTSGTGALATGVRGGPGVLAIVSCGSSTGSGGLTGGTVGARGTDLSSAGRGRSWLVVVSPCAATPAPCRLPFFDL